MKIRLLMIAAIAAVLCTTSFAASIETPYSYFNNWLPIIMIGVLLAIMLTAVHYMIGYLLGNNRIKAAALSEVQQALGSVVLTIIIITVLYLIGTSAGISFKGLLGHQTSDINSICNTLSGSQIAFLNSNNYGSVGSGPNGLGTFSIPGGGNLPQPTTAVCSIIEHGTGITSNIDYGLASTYLIEANLSNQSANTLNSLYNFDSIMFFLRNVQVVVSLCQGDLPLSCVNPLEPQNDLTLMFNPYYGYLLHRTIMPTMLTEGTLVFYLSFIELIILLLLMLTWPFLLAAGIILRTIPFTRRAGGLIVAATIVGIIILPTIFLFEYHSLNDLSGFSAASGLSPPGTDSYIGASHIPALALCGYGPMNGAPAGDVLYCYTASTSLNGSYICRNTACSFGSLPNTVPACASAAAYKTTTGTPFGTPACFIRRDLSLYTYPDSQGIINLYSCYPSSILKLEANVISGTILADNIVYLPLGLILGLFTNSLNAVTLFSPTHSIGGCLGGNTGNIAPYNVMATLSALTNLYGIIAVTGFIIPIINALMLISAITGLSSLMGGETTIIGLSRFV